MNIGNSEIITKNPNPKSSLILGHNDYIHMPIFMCGDMTHTFHWKRKSFISQIIFKNYKLSVLLAGDSQRTLKKKS